MPSELALRRLASQHLVGPPVADPGEVVRRSGAVQAQDYPAAKWAVAQRTESAAREEALAELANRYFSSHGPAQLADFAWWSGLTLRDVREGTDLAASQLGRDDLDGKTYWSGTSTEKPGGRPPSTHLLSNYDEYFIALRDRSAFFNPSRDVVGPKPEGVFDRHLVVASGDIVGGWRSTRERGVVSIGTRLVGRLDEAEAEALEAAAERYGRFLGLTARLHAE